MRTRERTTKKRFPEKHECDERETSFDEREQTGRKTSAAGFGRMSADGDLCLSGGGRIACGAFAESAHLECLAWRSFGRISRQRMCICLQESTGLIFGQENSC